MRNVAVLICIPVLATIAIAQDAQQGSITGFVYDQSQAVVPNTVVTVTNQATGLTRTAQTTEAGVYTVIGLQPGVYVAKATDSGFKSVEQTGIILGDVANFGGGTGAQRPDVVGDPKEGIGQSLT